MPIAPDSYGGFHHYFENKEEKMSEKFSPKEIIIDGVTYVHKNPIASSNGLDYCMVRTYSAGVFAGYLESREGKEAIVRNARRIYYWDGAATISQLAVDGTKAPQNCKFPVAVDKVILTEVIEVIPCTQKARKSIEGVPVWEI
jgi:hypothetical protein